LKLEVGSYLFQVSGFLPQIEVETPQFLKLFFLAMAKRPKEALAIA
jgi:hypothetical protein